jgi:hypothetical protein
VLYTMIHGMNDNMANPTQEEKQTYRLLENHMTLMGLSSSNQGGDERSIRIESPIDGSEVTGNVQITGDMPIAPFENNLRFSVYNLDGISLYQSGFMVTAADVGAPATFDNPVTLPVLPSGSRVRLELAELSMVDGSVNALDSVVVSIK